MKAIILVGGEGTRLRPLTHSAVKAMLPVLNKPFLEYVIRHLSNHKVNEVILALGYKPDLRDYGIGAQILSNLGIKQIKLITNNPRKIVGLEGYDLKVVERIPIEIEPNAANYNYLKTKKEKLGHNLNI